MCSLTFHVYPTVHENPGRATLNFSGIAPRDFNCGLSHLAGNPNNQEFENETINADKQYTDSAEN